MATKSKKSPPNRKAPSKVKSVVAKKSASRPAKTRAKKKASRPAKPQAKKKATPKKRVEAVAAKKPVAKKSVAKPVKKAPGASKPVVSKHGKNGVSAPGRKVEVTGFLAKQRQRLLMLKDTLLDSMNGVAKDSLRSRAEGSEASAFGMHQADAGSDAYDRDFALSLLSQEQDSLYEIDQALKRIETGTYGVCEISGKAIPHPRLEALPFTRYTVECQADIEKRNRFSRVRQPVTSLFGLGDDEGGDGDDEESTTDSKD
jgi:RNA polymerase-binding transcription factor DksA